MFTMSATLAKLATFAILLSAVMYVALPIRANSETPALAARIKYLMNELATTPARQQAALDELVKEENAAVGYLFQYLDDRRPLGTENVKFLNTHPAVSEKYYLTSSQTIDELTLRYLCWRTMVCDPGFNLHDKADIKTQRERIIGICRSRYETRANPCPRG